jgi:hypothetical protein
MGVSEIKAPFLAQVVQYLAQLGDPAANGCMVRLFYQHLHDHIPALTLWWQHFCEHSVTSLISTCHLTRVRRCRRPEEQLVPSNGVINGHKAILIIGNPTSTVVLVSKVIDSISITASVAPHITEERHAYMACKLHAPQLKHACF